MPVQMSVDLRARHALAFVDRHPVDGVATGAAIIFVVVYARSLLRWHGVLIWHGFFDQGLYLKSAKAFAALDFSPGSHYYPPLYPLLAAPFAWLTPPDPFGVIDLVFLSATAGMLAYMFGSVIGSAAVVGLFTLTFLLWPGVVEETVVIPWTSIPAMFFIISALYLLMRTECRGDVTRHHAIAFGLALGLTVPSRPLDAMAALTLVPFWMYGLWRGCAAAQSSRLAAFASRLVLSGLAAGIGPALLIGFNYLVYGQMLSPYMADSTNLFTLDNAAARFVSLFFDSAALFIQPDQNLAARFPWISVAICAAAVCLVYGANWLRAAAALVTVQFALYAGSWGLMPTGLYVYLNYHYFDWALWILLMLIPSAAVLLRRRFGDKAWKPAAVLMLFAGALACLQLKVTEGAASASRTGDRIVIEMPRGERIDYVDVAGVTADWPKTFFGDSHLTLDERPLARIPEFKPRSMTVETTFNGQALPKVADYQALLSANGTRFVFLRPVEGGRLEFPVTGWTITPPYDAVFGRHDFAIGFPKWVGKRQNKLRRGLPVRLDAPSAAYIFANGFGPFDGRGRVIRRREAIVKLALEPTTGPYVVWVGIAANVPVKVDIKLVGSAAAALTLDIDAREREFAVAVPESAVSTWGPTSIGIEPRGEQPDKAAAAGEVRVTSLRLE